MLSTVTTSVSMTNELKYINKLLSVVSSTQASL